MALALKTKPPAEAAIPPITDDPEFAAANDLLAALNAQLRDAERKVKIAELLPWANRGPKTDRDNVQRQLQALRAEEGTVPSRRVVPVIERAVNLMFGEREPEPMPDEEVAQARRDILLLDEAIRAQSEVVRDLRDRKSFEICKAMIPEHRARALAFYRAAQDLARSRDAMDGLHRDLLAAGYIDRIDILPQLGLGGAYAIGAETVWESQLSTLRRQLEDRGIL